MRQHTIIGTGSRLCAIVMVIFLAEAGLSGNARSASAAGTPVSAEVLNPLIGQPQRNFHQAFSLFVQGDNEGAASEINAAAAMLRLEAAREAGSNDSGLLSAATSLDDLASRIKGGDVGSRDELSPVFVKADLALAAHYRAMANQAVTDQHHNAAGRWLGAASDAVDDATHWTGHEPPTPQAQAWDQVHALDTKIRNGANWTYDEARHGVGYLGNQIQYLGAQMQKLGATAAPSPAP